jgi:hypothetical protein
MDDYSISDASFKRAMILLGDAEQISTGVRNGILYTIARNGSSMELMTYLQKCPHCKAIPHLLQYLRECPDFEARRTCYYIFDVFVLPGREKFYPTEEYIAWQILCGQMELHGVRQRVLGQMPALLGLYHANPLLAKAKAHFRFKSHAVYSLVVFYADSLLRLKAPTCKNSEVGEAPTKRTQARRFFAIAVALPLELQMVLCQRLAGRSDDIITASMAQGAFQALAAAFFFATKNPSGCDEHSPLGKNRSLLARCKAFILL